MSPKNLENTSNYEGWVLTLVQKHLLCNFIEITLWHGCSTVNLLHIFRTPVDNNTYGGLPLLVAYKKVYFNHELATSCWRKRDLMIKPLVTLLSCFKNWCESYCLQWEKIFKRVFAWCFSNICIINDMRYIVPSKIENKTVNLKFRVTVLIKYSLKCLCI